MLIKSTKQNNAYGGHHTTINHAYPKLALSLVGEYNYSDFKFRSHLTFISTSVYHVLAASGTLGEFFRIAIKIIHLNKKMRVFIQVCTLRFFSLTP
jgi:hypothetical protein